MFKNFPCTSFPYNKFLLFLLIFNSLFKWDFSIPLWFHSFCIWKLLILYLNFITCYLTEFFYFLSFVIAFFLVFSRHNTVSSVNYDSFTCLPILMPLIVFVCLIALANTSSVVISSSRNSRHSCLVLGVRSLLFFYWLR